MDGKFIDRCFELAAKGSGRVSPNPLVGSVIAKNNRIIGEGWHEKFGLPHAEVNAINNATEDLKGSVLYCNLEPCSHINKKTPPCTPQIINTGISRAVISNTDPNPSVSGRGITELRNAGIKVSTGIGKEEGNDLNRFYFTFIKTKKPYVTLKISQSSDGKITDTLGKQTWISSKEAGEFVHSQRGIYDAVLVGAKSIYVDNPQLNVRHTDGRNPVRIVLDGNLSAPLNSRIFNSEDPDKTWIITSEKSDKERINKLKDKGIRIFELTSKNGYNNNLNEILDLLGELNIASLFVEGGNQIFSRFIENDLYNEIILLQAPKFFGKGLNSVSLTKTKSLKLKSVENIGDDIKIVLRKDQR
jgi:diaminohydroxyphosphoribosylaminopyrimidine deaminase/5-amino-6-(5-phosphoribosylamino)uracil reductase